jgi:hypothetical protein
MPQDRFKLLPQQDKPSLTKNTPHSSISSIWILDDVRFLGEWTREAVETASDDAPEALRELLQQVRVLERRVG